jgi:hypothetical protein
METENLERMKRDWVHARKVRLIMFLIACAATVASVSMTLYLAIRGGNPVSHGIAIVLGAIPGLVWFVCLSRQRADIIAKMKILEEKKGIFAALLYRLKTAPRRRPRARRSASANLAGGKHNRRLLYLKSLSLQLWRLL